MERTYSSWDLRQVLAAIPMRFSTSRRLAALAPLVAAACCWFAVPSWASTPPVTVASTGGCAQPQPVISLTGPAAIAPGQAATFTATAARRDPGGGSATLALTLPAGFRFGAPPPGAVLSGQDLSVPLPATAGTSVEVAVVAPSAATSTAVVSASHSVVAPPEGRCHRRLATSSSLLTTRVTAAAAPVDGTGSISVTAFQSAPSRDTGAPVTGAGSGLLRTSLVGFCLMLSGLVVLTGTRRNPHAEAIAAGRN